MEAQSEIRLNPAQLIAFTLFTLNTMMKPKHNDAFCTKEGKYLFHLLATIQLFFLTEKLAIELRPGNLTGIISQTSQQEQTATKHVHILTGFEQIF